MSSCPSNHTLLLPKGSEAGRAWLQGAEADPDGHASQRLLWGRARAAPHAALAHTGPPIQPASHTRRIWAALVAARCPKSGLEEAAHNSPCALTTAPVSQGWRFELALQPLPLTHSTQPTCAATNSTQLVPAAVPLSTTHASLVLCCSLQHHDTRPTHT